MSMNMKRASTEQLKDDDRISSLPDELLCHILTFLPTKQAVATSILSTRWKNLSDFVPNIDLSDPYFSSNCSEEKKARAIFLFMDFLIEVLRVRTLPTTREIPKFRLHCRNKYDHDILSDLIYFIVMRTIRELDLWVQLDENDQLPDEVFMCKSLEVLKLGGELQLSCTKAYLPNLRVIELGSVDLSDFNTLDLLLSCPVLEELLLKSCYSDNYNVMEISHPLLKTLVLYDCWGEIYVIFDTPNLHNLLFTSNSDYFNFTVKNLKSLVHAYVSWGSSGRHDDLIEDEDFENLSLESTYGTRFINEMHEARFLYLNDDAINALYYSDCKMTTFHNLTLMELGSTDGSGWLVLPNLLQSTPNLKVLVFCQGFISPESSAKDFDYRLPGKQVPACFCGSLEEIKIKVYNGHDSELVLIEYFLKRVQGLKIMMIGTQVSSVSPFEYPRLYGFSKISKKAPGWLLPTSKRLSAAPRCSKTCQIILTWEKRHKKYQKILGSPHPTMSEQAYAFGNF